MIMRFCRRLPGVVFDHLSRARVLKVCAVAGSRTAGYFRDAKGDIRADAVAERISEPQHLIVHATKAPAKVVPLTILPAFKFEPHPKLPLTVERKVRLRVRMQRPWFSSGEGERLGIVLWPPDLTFCGWIPDRLASPSALNARGPHASGEIAVSPAEVARPRSGTRGDAGRAPARLNDNLAQQGELRSNAAFTELCKAIKQQCL